MLGPTVHVTNRVRQGVSVKRGYLQKLGPEGFSDLVRPAGLHSTSGVKIINNTAYTVSHIAGSGPDIASYRMLINKQKRLMIR